MNVHVRLMSRDSYTPPSSPISRWLGFPGSIQMACTSSCAAMRASVSIVRPPSIVICIPTPPMYTRSGLMGSMRTWLKYIGRGLVLLTLRHVAPPSSER